MSSFDFTALLKFLGALFDAFVKLFEKLGLELPGAADEGDGEGDSAEATV